MGNLQTRSDGSFVCPACGEGKNLHFVGASCVGCDDCHIPSDSMTVDVAAAERVMRRRDAWRETALQQSRNADYYCGLLDQIAEGLGRKAYVGEDGREQEEPVRARLPALVAERLLDYEKLDLLFVRQGRAVHEFLKVFEAVRNNGIANALPSELHQRYRDASDALDAARNAIRDEAVKRGREP